MKRTTDSEGTSMGTGYQKTYSLSAPLRVDPQTRASKQDPFTFFAGLRDAGPVIPLSAR